MSASSTPFPPRVVVGLGNPGDRYRDTRHNLGFRVVEELARRRGSRLDSESCRAWVDPRPPFALVAPQTYMNRSGYSLRCLVERHDVAPEGFLVVYDEMHLPLGRLRLRRGGSPGGHRGMESVLESLGTDAVPRLRLGIAGEDGAPEGDEIVAWVLAPFPADEEEVVEVMVRRAADACERWAADGLEAAMQEFNA